MNKHNRKKRNHTTMERSIASSEAINPNNAVEPKWKDLLFHPLIYKSKSTRTIDFESIQIPFLIRENRIYMIMFMDGFGDISIYTECIEADPEKPSETYRDALYLMKECFEIQQLTGTRYYFGHLDSSLEHYLYALQLFIDRNILTKERAMEIIEELGFNADDMIKTKQSVVSDIEQTEQQKMAAKEWAFVNEIITKFIISIMTSTDEGNEATNDGTDSQMP